MSDFRSLVTFGNFFPSHVATFVSDRTVDFALEKSEGLLSEQQQKLLSLSCGISDKQLRNIKQVHGRRVVFLSGKSCFTPKRQRKADGVLTGAANVPLTVRTADCLSIFIYDKKHQVIGLIHAGWKGTRKNIIIRALELMKTKWETNPKDLLVAFGPSIKECCYQVGKEFLKIFPEEIRSKKDGLYLNLPLVNKRQLLKAGVAAKNIFDCDICTFCNPRCFSYRKEGVKAGRMISVMMLKQSLL